MINNRVKIRLNLCHLILALDTEIYNLFPHHNKRYHHINDIQSSVNVLVFTITGPCRGRGPGADLHPSHLVGDLLHGGRGAVVLGVGGGVLPGQVHGPLAVWLRHSRPGNTHFKVSPKYI